MTPLIIFHTKAKEYASLCINQALQYNNEIYLVTDALDYYKNNNPKLKLVNVNKYSSIIKKFKQKYRNFSQCEQFEFTCIVRWLINYEVMKEYNIERALICDSDVLIYDNIDQVDKKYLRNKDLWLCTSPSKSVTGGQSIWSRDKLKDFSNFINKFYDTQISNLEKFWKDPKRMKGNVCDMTLLYYFCHNAEEFVGLRLPDLPYFQNDLSQVFNEEITFDINLSVAGNHTDPASYTMELSRKAIEFINNQPYGFNKKLNKKIRFILLHFHGGKKKLMKHFTRKQKA